MCLSDHNCHVHIGIVGFDGVSGRLCLGQRKLEGECCFRFVIGNDVCLIHGIRISGLIVR